MANENTVLVSVVIPCRNEERYISRTIKNIFDSEFDANRLEIIVVDGMSDDGTLSVLDKLSNEHPNIRVIENKNRTTPFAFNIGIRNCSGEYLLIVGARHLISRNYISGCIDSLNKDKSIAAAGGRVINIFEDSTGEGISLAMGSPFGVGGGNFRAFEKSCEVDTIGTPMFRKEVFEKVGMFDEELARNQDDEFSYRIIQAGYKLWLNCDIEIRYYVRPDFSKLFRQYLQYGYWKVYVNKKLKTVTTKRQLIPVLFILFLLLYPVTLLFSTVLFYVYPAVIFMYITVALLFSVKASRGFKKVTAKVFFSFLCLHFGYGIGYLYGIFHFLIAGKTPHTKMGALTR